MFTFPHSHVLNSVFRQLQLFPHDLTFSNFQTPSRVYIRISACKETAKLFYVGSTEQAVHLREATRFRKFKQVQQDKLVSAELCIRYWHKMDNFWDWVTVPVMFRTDPDQLLGAEHALIQTLQPPLNYPYIAQWFSPKRGIVGSHNLGKISHDGLGRLYRKRRKAATLPSRLGYPPIVAAVVESPVFRDKENTWRLLAQLGSNTLARFEASKQIRSHAFDFATLCLLHKLAQHLPVHLASSAKQAIQQAIRFKGFEPPPHGCPLVIPFLATSNVRGRMRELMRQFITANRPSLIPFHVPRTTVVFGKNPKLHQSLFTHKLALRSWARGETPPCMCSLIARFAPDAQTFAGHLAASGDQMNRHLPPIAQRILRSNMNNAFFPNRERAFEAFEKGVRRWLFRHHLPQQVCGIAEIFSELWDSHLQEVGARFHHGVLHALKATTKGLVWHCEDHHAHRALCYCPQLYHDMLTNTFVHSDIFAPVEGPIAEYIHGNYREATARFRKRYPWAFRATPRTPYAFGLPKRKKDFKVARPIISFVGAFMRPLLEAVAKLIFQLTAVTFPEAFASGDVYDLIREIQVFFARIDEQPDNPEFQDIMCRNQDLSGFFTSVSAQQFHDGWEFLLGRYTHLFGCQHDASFTIDVVQREQSLRIFRGTRRKRAKQHVCIYIQDVADIISHALRMQIFGIAHKAFRQLKGSPMGSPISPALCSMVISGLEDIWKRTFSSLLRNISLTSCFLRYVDNRILFCPRHVLVQSGIRLLQNPQFYGQDILLEDEMEFDFLGFAIDVQGRRVMYRRNLTSYDLMDVLSASPEHVLVSGVLARASVIKKCSYPATQRHADLHYLWDQAQEAGLPVHDSRVKRKFFRCKDRFRPEKTFVLMMC